MIQVWQDRSGPDKANVLGFAQHGHKRFVVHGRTTTPT